MIEKLKQEFNAQKRKYLKYSILLDLLGMASYVFPFMADLTDIVFAPIYGVLIFYLYRRNTLPAILGGLFGATEEILVFSDGIPTATIMWFYTYIFRRKATFDEFVNERQTNETILTYTD